MWQKERGVLPSITLILVVFFGAEAKPNLISFRKLDSEIVGRMNFNRNFYIRADGSYDRDSEISSCSINGEGRNFEGRILEREISPDQDGVIRLTKKVAVRFPIEKSIHYPVFKKLLYPVKVPNFQPYAVEKELPYPVKVYVKVPVKIPRPVPVVKEVPYPVKIPVERPVPVKIFIPRPYPVEKTVHYEVEVPVPQPFPIEKEIPVPVRVYEHIGQPYPVELEDEKHVDHRQEEIENPSPIIEYPKNSQPWLAEEVGDD